MSEDTQASPLAGDAPTDLHEPLELEGPALAYSDAVEVAEVMPWRSAWRVAAVVFFLAVIATGGVALLLGLLSSDASNPAPVAAPASTTTVAPPPVVAAPTSIPPPPPVTTTATVTVEPSPSTVTMVPQAAPVTPPPPPRRPIQQGLQAAEQDQRFLNSMRGIGMIITDPVAAVAGAHNACTYLAAGHSEAQMAAEAMRNNPTMSPWQANAYAGAVVGVYCPDQAD